MDSNNTKLVLELIRETRKDMRELRSFVQEHMEKEDENMQKIERRLSKLEWRVHGLAAVAGMLGGLFITKIKALLGLDSGPL